LASVAVVSTAVHSGGSCARRSKHQSPKALTTFFRIFSLPRSWKSRRRTTSLISVSSLAIRSLATRRTTFEIRSCHSMSQSVISIWLRGTLITVAPCAVPVVATVRFWTKAWNESALPRWRFR
jgi:hypothetical protein